MPGPAIIGLAGLGTLIATVLTDFFQWLLTRQAKKIAILTILAALLYAAVDTLIGSVSGLISSLISSAPSGVVSFGYMLPSNSSTCVGAVISTELVCAGYGLFNRTFKLKLEAAS